MPCNDVTEVLLITLNNLDELQRYQLNKWTCGSAVGQESLLQADFINKNIPEITSITVEDFLEHYKFTDILDEFMYLKHLFALQAALNIYAGAQSGGKNDAAVIREVLYKADSLELFFELKIDILTEKIQSCGKCVGCGTKYEVKLPEIGAGLPLV